MRKQHWLAPVFSAFLMLVCGRDVAAQSNPAREVVRQPPSPISISGTSVHEASFAPGMQAPQQAASIPSYGAVAFPGQPGGAMPAGMNPWPAGSPFDHHYSQHQNEEGLWFWNNNSRGRQFRFTADALISKYRMPAR